ncbi:hypothetical protein IWW38_000769 [Coemansia aciculifera]|uniref:Uncharacterized protein n=1 Tax=Coemansia aciculifera TaxID=417176 RepID=A0ACC1M863_9FUNG|nr:hypothetical protein IWW38_000769 [Coemansia aciculifera]
MARSILPRWYAECKFLHSDSIRLVSDSTDYFTFGRIFRTPTNPRHQDANHLRVDFCHLEFCHDYFCRYHTALCDPPHDIAGIAKRDLTVERCTIDFTLMGPVDDLIDSFVAGGYQCHDRDLVDLVMCRETESPAVAAAAFPSKASERVTRVLDPRDIVDLAQCNARSFNYSSASDTDTKTSPPPAWLVEKLGRQMRQPDNFHIYSLDHRAFVVLFVPPREKARDVALVQVIGTDPAARRQGLATEVLAHALSCLPPEVSRVYLEVLGHEEGARTMYEKLGFAVVGTCRSAEFFLH